MLAVSALWDFQSPMSPLLLQCFRSALVSWSHSLRLFSILSLSKTSDPYNKLLIQLKDFVEF